MKTGEDRRAPLHRPFAATAIGFDATGGSGSGAKAFARIERLVAARDRSRAELSRKLASFGFDERAIEESLERALRCGLVDDDRFASALARTRVAAGKGRIGIEEELSRHEIDPLSVEGWPERYLGDGEEESERAFRLLERKPPRAKNLREASFRKLVYNGYDRSIAASVARRWSDVREDVR